MASVHFAHLSFYPDYTDEIKTFCKLPDGLFSVAVVSVSLAHLPICPFDGPNKNGAEHKNKNTFLRNMMGKVGIHARIARSAQTHETKSLFFDGTEMSVTAGCLPEH